MSHHLLSYHVDVISGTLTELLYAPQAFKLTLPVLAVPKNGAITNSRPVPVSLLKVRLEFPEIVFVIFVQVSADNEPVSKG